MMLDAPDFFDSLAEKNGQYDARHRCAEDDESIHDIERPATPAMILAEVDITSYYGRRERRRYKAACCTRH